MHYRGGDIWDSEVSDCKTNFKIMFVSCKDIYIFAPQILKRNMLVILVKDGENIDRALKRFKRKFLKTGTLKQIRERKQYIKKSERLRIKKQKAVYSEALLRDLE